MQVLCTPTFFYIGHNFRWLIRVRNGWWGGEVKKNRHWRIIYCIYEKVGSGFRVIQLRNSDWGLRNFNQPRILLRSIELRRAGTHGPGVAFSYAAAGKHKQVKKRYKVQGIRDAEQPNGLYERYAIGALWASLYELGASPFGLRPHKTTNKSLEEQPCGL